MRSNTNNNMLNLHKKLVAGKDAVFNEEKEAVSMRLGKIRYLHKESML